MIFFIITGNINTSYFIIDCSNNTYWHKSILTEEVYKICEDNDGIVITKPDGSQDSYGTDYKIQEIIETYKLLSNPIKSKKNHCEECSSN